MIFRFFDIFIKDTLRLKFSQNKALFNIFLALLVKAAKITI